MRQNVVRMDRPGPRQGPTPGQQAALTAQIGALQAQLQQKDLMIAQMQNALANNRQMFEDMKGRSRNMAIHLAALLHEKHGDCAWVDPATVDYFGTLMEKSEFGGFDLTTIGPDAVGPRRHKMAYLTMVEMQKKAQDQISMARAQGVRPAAPAAIEAPIADPVPCPGPWHKTLNAPGDACKKCGLSFPRGE